jgi:hypothetical protein
MSSSNKRKGHQLHHRPSKAKQQKTEAPSATAATPNGKSTTFLALPHEIRQQILLHAFHGTRHRLAWVSGSYQWYRFIWFESDTFRYAPSTKHWETTSDMEKKLMKVHGEIVDDIEEAVRLLGKEADKWRVSKGLV